MNLMKLVNDLHTKTMDADTYKMQLDMDNRKLAQTADMTDNS